MSRFRIRDDAGKILYESGVVRGGEPARRFIVRLEGRKELILEVHKVDTIDHAHADWVDLHVTPSHSSNVTSLLGEEAQLPRGRT
jgi:hypothetical protein